jgi:hypothetical protein
LSTAPDDKAALAINPPERANASAEAGRSAKGKKQKSFRWAVWLVAFLIFGVVASIVGLVYITAGSVNGSEFDAVNWTTRDFRFVRDPFTEAQLTNVKHSGSRFTVDPAIAAHITGGPARPVHPRWDLIQIYRGLSPGTGEAHILLEYLQASDKHGKNYWVEWTNSHPKAAPILWGAVRDAVHLERYDRLPEIFDRVRIHDDPKALKESLAKLMVELAQKEAQQQVKSGDQAAARRAARVGLSYGQSDQLRALAGDSAGAAAQAE